MKPLYSDHERLDRRSLSLHKLVAEKVVADPALLDQARENVRRWQQNHDSPSLALAEWEQILKGSVEEITHVLIDQSEKATRLRQSSPFTGILTELERLAIYESYSIRTHHPAASQILGDTEIVVIGSQAIHAQPMRLPSIDFQSDE